MDNIYHGFVLPGPAFSNALKKQNKTPSPCTRGRSGRTCIVYRSAAEVHPGMRPVYVRGNAKAGRDPARYVYHSIIPSYRI
jgi:hypothetical protein